MNSSTQLYLTCTINLSATSWQKLDTFAENFIFITYTYIIPSVSIASIFPSILVTMCLYFLILKKDSYKLLFIRTILTILISLINIGIQDTSCLTCRSMVFTSYFNNFFRLYLSRGCLLALTSSVMLIELFLLNDRICLLRNKKNFIFNMGILFQSSFSIVVPFLAYLPEFLAYYIEYHCDNVFIRKLSWFGKSNFFFFYTNIFTIIYQGSIVLTYMIFSLKSLF